ncbi:MAG: S1C family serine protease [Enterocloster clostridioformis]
MPSSGSGIIIGENDKELLIVTNNHVVEDSTSLKAAFIDSEVVDAAIKGTDAETDLAVIAVPLEQIKDDTKSKIKVARLGNSDELKVGQGVIAIGNALGYGQSVTVGYVSALNREVRVSNTSTRELLQTDAAINPGNSGGALLNMRGRLSALMPPSIPPPKWRNRLCYSHIQGRGHHEPRS